jgi:hypothetical protein
MLPFRHYYDHHSLRTVLFCLTAALIMGSCANQVAPTGGPKDEEPPKVIREEPANYSTNFRSTRIKITFDEFVILESPQKNVLISPPFASEPVVKLHGRTLDIQLKDTLKDNTTYTIYFSNAIADITENNKLRNYSYIFSTGEDIDMYGIRGKVSDAFSQAPEDGMAVMLYPVTNDSLPFRLKPYYLSRTNNKGEFEFGNIGAGPYWLIALADANSNLIYDLPNEKIAFAETPIVPYELEELIDSATSKRSYYAPDPVIQQLSSFDEFDGDIKIMKSGMRSPGLAEIILNRPVDVLDFRILYGSESSFRKEINIRNDSLLLWLQSPAPDSLVLEIMANGLTFDTALILPNKAISAKASAAPKLRLQANIQQGGKHPANAVCRINTTFPILIQNDSLILLLEGTDTLRPAIRFTDRELMKSFVVEHVWKENQSYTLLIKPGTFVSLNGIASDSLRLSFTTFQAGDLGNLGITLNDTLRKGQIIISLLDKAGKEIDRKILQETDNRVVFRDLLPDDYSIRAHFDANENGFWDPGSSIPPRQAEKIFLYQKAIQIKANWDLDLEWQIR